MRLFGGGGQRSADAIRQTRIARHSSGWGALQKDLRDGENLRTLDIGPTSSTNINLLTELGHSVYMADMVTESHDPRWVERSDDGTERFRAREFVTENLKAGERLFNVVLLWDCLDFLPPAAVPEVVARIHDTMAPGARCLVFSRAKNEGNLSRFHLRADDSVDVQMLADLPPRQVYTNRQIEVLFSQFSTYKFFLAKDNFREILVTR